MRAAALVLALVHTLPVTTLDAFVNVDNSVTLFWTLPDDPSVVGVTVVRERLDVLEADFAFPLGLETSITDFSTVFNAGYRYWVYTRDDFGNLSTGVFVEVFTSSDPVFIDGSTTQASFVCWATAAPGPSLWPAALAAVLISWLGALRRGRWARRLRNRSL